MKISTIRVLAVLYMVILTSSVHIQKHREYDQDAYLKALESQQDNFETGISELKDSVSRVDDSVSEATVIEQKISLLEGAIVDQEDQIFQLSTKMIPPLDLSTCNCEKLSKEDREKLAARADTTLQRINDLKTELDSMNRTDDAEFVEMQRNADSQIFYLESIKKVLDSNCTSEAILTPTVYQSNIYAKNWILGNQDINDVVQSYIDRSKNYDSITNCPIDTPFYDRENCIQCEEDTPVFNMETKECEACPENTELDSKIRQCVEKGNFISNIFTSQPWVTEDGDTTKVLQDTSQQAASGKFKYCPKETPFVIDEECRKCDYGQVYHVELKVCVAPGEDYVYNANTHTIVEPEEGKETDPNANNLLAYGDLADLEQLENCPEDRPYYDDIACIACTEPTSLFNTATKRCVACQPEQFYNAESRSCQTRQVLFENGNYLNLVGLPHDTVEDYLQKIVEMQEQHPEAILSECGETENSAFTSCVQCEDGQVFNVGTMECGKCASLNLEKKICNDGVYFEGDIEKGNGTIATDEDIESYNKDKEEKKTNAVDTVTCPEDQPFSDGTKCFACKDDMPLFNVSSLACTSCPEKEEFNAETKSCQGAAALYLGNPEKATNLVGDSQEQVDEYLDQQSKAAASAGNPVICPKDKPYSNNKECFACEAPDVMFNVTSQECTSCPEGDNYISDESRCGACAEGTLYDEEEQECKSTSVTFITNPGVGKYIGESEGDVKEYIDNSMEEAKTTANAAVCPVDTPYSNGADCIACTDETPYFNIKTKECADCEGNSLYNKETSVCEECPEGYAVNEDRTECEQYPTATSSKVFNQVLVGDNATIDTYQPSEDQMQCPEDTPFYTTENGCVSCEDDQLFNLDTETCEKCPEGQSYVVATHSCQEPSGINPKSMDQVISKDQLPEENQEVVPCPEKTPFFDGSICISCSEQNPLFDFDSKHCTSCPDGTVLDISEHECVQPNIISNFESGKNRILVPEGKDYDQIKDQYESMKNIKTCPVDTPFSDGTKCLDCELGQIFNIETSSCQECPGFTVFDKKTHNCEEQQMVSNQENYNWISEDAEQVQKDNQDAIAEGNTECTDEKPFSIGTTCISCEEDTFFNTDQQSCVACPEGEVLDTHNHVCVQPVKFQTNPLTAQQLIYDGIAEKELVQVYNTQKTGDHPAEDCPEDKPYFNGASCIVCTGTKPYFKMHEMVCQDCAEGTEYDTATHECLEVLKQDQNASGMDTSPSLGKLAANVFSHNKRHHQLHIIQ